MFQSTRNLGKMIHRLPKSKSQIHSKSMGTLLIKLALHFQWAVPHLTLIHNLLYIRHRLEITLTLRRASTTLTPVIIGTHSQIRTTNLTIRRTKSAALKTASSSPPTAPPPQQTLKFTLLEQLNSFTLRFYA